MAIGKQMNASAEPGSFHVDEFLQCSVSNIVGFVNWRNIVGFIYFDHHVNEILLVIFFLGAGVIDLVAALG